ncbi:flagellar filament capping protein FliD [Caryophanon tenue]|uniref:Flagellar hook-associated protein 2 n=1 Tax=Caryophanon tenue TaxID=33978 RepID=A0A1C0YJU5_9BACL|nr:flagellar filament capping protein FliD [Caryophanon tenue]OCS87430.1 hypothetical protein A6M13_08920 [Caryophanon tenue]
MSGMRIGGLASGMDIDSIVEKLMQAERIPVDKLSQKKQTYEWQRDAYRDVNTKLKTLDTYISDNLILKSMNSKTATSSNSSLVSATATGTASGNLSIEGVSRLATAAQAVGNRQVNATGDTKVSSLTSETSLSFKAIQANGQMAAEATEIKFDANTTVSQLMAKINGSNAGVTAVFENGRLSISAKNTGDNKAGAEVEVTAGAGVLSALGMDTTNGEVANGGQNARFSVNGIATERSTNTFSLNGYNVTLNATFNESATHDKFDTAANTTLTHANENLTKLLTTLFGSNKYGVTLTNNLAGNMDAVKTAIDNRLTEQQEAVDNARSAVTTKRDTLIDNKKAGTLYDGLSQKAKDFLLNSTATNKVDFDAAVDAITDETMLTEADKTALKGLTGFTAVKDAGIETKNNAAYNGLSQKAKDFLLSSTATDNASFETAVNAITDETVLSEEDKTALKNLEFTAVKAAGEELEIQKAYSSLSSKAKDFLLQNATTSDKAAFDAAVDAADETILTEADKKALKALDTERRDLATKEAELNVTKADATNLTNTVNAYNNAQNTVNTAGTAPATTVTSAAITLSSTTNVDDMMNKIKEFVATYNGFVKDLTDKTKETKYRDYAPLTAEQKKEMEEEEIKLWEEKSKSGLLRNDALIRNGLADMRGLVYETHHGVDNQKFNSLYSIGIGTSKNYNDGGTLEIDEAKLRKAIEEDPNAVEQLFKNTAGTKEDTVTYTTRENGVEVEKTKKADTRGFLYQLRDSMKQMEINIEKKAGRSTMTDAQYSLGKTLIDTNKRLDSWEDKLKAIEDRYWKQFTAMETAINNANQQSSLFAQG